MTATIDVAAPCCAWRQVCPGAEEVARAAIRQTLAYGDAGFQIPRRTVIEIAVCLADDAMQQQLNRDWRGVDRPTNVLAFPAWEPGAPIAAGAPLLLGDIVLAFETVSREAEGQDKPLADHLAHLVVHGVLHLLGYDHAAEAEAVAMEALETAILARLGVPDPYRGTM
ncbi:MAG TPA: rRNA maturation RNase YbeY [Stellaceae bacterium]|nr:rRNA maturation RNase YbeY [Stellaceae bacterium]